MSTVSQLAPHTVYPVTADRIFHYVHACAGSNFKHIEGLGFEASLGADSTWRLGWFLPPTLPGGTCKLALWMLANATSGIAKINPKWKSWAAGEDPSSAALNAEGTTPDSKSGQAGSGSSMEWGASDNDQLLLAKWVLDADTPVAGEFLAMDLVGETSGWTLAQILTVVPLLIWE